MNKISKKPSFTNTNFSVCMYCSNIVVFSSRLDYYHGCKIRRDNEGKYANIDKCEEGRTFSILEKGCNDFKSSGLPAYPKVLKELIKINPLTRGIPADKSAIETSWDFAEKLRDYLPPENFLKREDQIQ
jgi:hypothetical protein